MPQPRWKGQFCKKVSLTNFDFDGIVSSSFQVFISGTRLSEFLGNQMAFLQINLTYFRYLAFFFAAHTSQIYVWVLPLMLKPLNRVCTFILGYLFVGFCMLYVLMQLFVFIQLFHWRILHFLRTYLPSHWLFSQPLFQLRLLGHTLLRFPITLLVFVE